MNLSTRLKEIEKLPTEQRRVLELVHFGGYTQARIAEELGMSVGTVKTRTLAAMRKLRRHRSRED